MQQWILRWSLILLLSSNYPILLYAMDSDTMPIKKYYEELRSLPRELQENILLSQDSGFLQETINFLGLQPITLTGHTNPIVSVALYGDIIETKSKNPQNITWCTILWNIHTGQHIWTVESPCKSWEKEGPAVISGDKAINIRCMYGDLEVMRSDKIGLWDINTGELLREVEYEYNILLLASDNNRIAIGFSNTKVMVCPIEKEKDTPMILFEYSGEMISSLALYNNIVIIGSKSGCIEVWDINTGEQVNWCNKGEHIDQVTSITVHENKVLFGLYDGAIKIWNMDTQALEKTLIGPNRHIASVKSIATDGNIAVTGSKDCTAKIWPLKINLQGTSDDNPLIWIIYKTDMLQLDFIIRACNATKNEQEFVIDLPKKLGIIKEDESPEQADGRIYFTLPSVIRECLKKRLIIRRIAGTVIEKVQLAYAGDNCALM